MEIVISMLNFDLKFLGSLGPLKNDKKQCLGFSKFENTTNELIYSN